MSQRDIEISEVFETTLQTQDDNIQTLAEF